MTAAAASNETNTSQREVWRDLLRDHFVSLDVDVERDYGSFDGAVHSSFLGHLQVSGVRSVDQDVIRTKELLRCDGERYFQVCLVRRGEARATQDGHEATLRPGDFVIYETERPFHWALRSDAASPYWDLAVFTWPRDTIQLSDSESVSLTCRTLDGGSGITGVLSRMLTDVLVAKPTVSEAGALRIADEIGDLVATIATETHGLGEGTDRHASLLRRIDTYIDEHLGDPDMSPERVAQAHFVSTRQLQRMFARRGQTVSQVIRRQRLERCRRDLLTRRGGDATLTEICVRWGFTDLAVFSRAFRETYGTSPTAYRTRARA
ncbi:helix-turn-helix domain-containing protein [Streptomyces sp. DSM 40750]|uniref:helix-turn-helix domain-containing protein n=1 Tax=Streptomyces sp. DSM 40750 TaxID=2801030 RepID=UPI00214B7E08|nr:helix-turn-helix domain-containing protein [Streptomyces sp. DSM 40750]UUU19609.1 helix-turn-helix domain-containing protein [Streptomyces sp. DSM 40750]UUU27049.1 helix-turn-helix domain-containing protein [Streptomyces sp. DSM 40750]